MMCTTCVYGSQGCVGDDPRPVQQANETTEAVCIILNMAHVPRHQRKARQRRKGGKVLSDVVGARFSANQPPTAAAGGAGAVCPACLGPRASRGAQSNAVRRRDAVGAASPARLLNRSRSCALCGAASSRSRVTSARRCVFRAPALLALWALPGLAPPCLPSCISLCVSATVGGSRGRHRATYGPGCRRVLPAPPSIR